MWHVQGQEMCWVSLRKSEDTWSRWVDNIRMDRKETGWYSVDQNGLTRDKEKWQAANMVMSHRLPQNEGIQTSFGTISFSRSTLLFGL